MKVSTKYTRPSSKGKQNKQKTPDPKWFSQQDKCGSERSLPQKTMTTFCKPTCPVSGHMRDARWWGAGTGDEERRWEKAPDAASLGGSLQAESGTLTSLGSYTHVFNHNVA